MTDLQKVHNLLFEFFAPQHWWPVTKKDEIIPKYHKNIKLNEKQKLEICFGAILTQYSTFCQ